MYNNNNNNNNDFHKNLTLDKTLNTRLKIQLM